MHGQQNKKINLLFVGVFYCHINVILLTISWCEACCIFTLQAVRHFIIFQMKGVLTQVTIISVTVRAF